MKPGQRILPEQLTVSVWESVGIVERSEDMCVMVSPLISR